MLLRFISRYRDPRTPSIFSACNSFKPEEITGNGVFCFVENTQADIIDENNDIVDRVIMDFNKLEMLFCKSDEDCHFYSENNFSHITYGEGYYNWSINDNTVAVVKEAYCIW